MKKQIFLFIIGLLAYVLGGFLSIVEFVLYATKQDPFDWRVVLPFVFGIILMTINFPYNVKRCR